MDRTGRKGKPLFKKWWFWVVVVVVVLAVGGAIGGGSSNGSDGASATSTATRKDGRSSDGSSSESSTDDKASEDGASKAAGTEKTIELQATATGNGTVMWFKDGSSNTEQFSGSWSKTFTGDEAKDLNSVSVSGDLLGDDAQKVTCKVIVNGEEKESKEASGASGSAYCTVPWL
ncbi:hypothetical protein [Bifidobacterium platyrrhinorum]|uniref:Uncharacterized protein n=1 Tax=Bifidobacterium platyrrhinorum TaxID=2661628 RepID=A0A6L9SQK7_9BIFI|nr:hypothetical protein [Bifidobacterium platyrrhinorum]NEG54445.1 hypothetical protein [Bifidobacterium platyrrhinorum]